MHTESIDLSRTGFRCRTVESLDPGSSVFVMITIGDDSIQAEAMAVHAHCTETAGCEVGFEFVSMSDSDRAQVTAYLEQAGSHRS